MPELSELKPWDSVTWDNHKKDSGTVHLERRPYYYKIVGAGEDVRILVISAVSSGVQVMGLHAVDYLRLDRNGFDKLMQVGKDAFGTS
jgi:hypothetical protein